MPSREAAPLVFYPAYCFKASPTWFVWVKLTAHDIYHVLRSRPGFAAATTNPRSELLFYLNHPIQYVQVIGVVVEYEDYNEKFWSITVDDGSGGVINCMCWKPDKDQVKPAGGQNGDAMPEKTIDDEQQKRENVIKSIDIGTVVQVKGTFTSFHEVRQIQIERLTVVPTTNDEIKLIAARTKFLEEVLVKPWVVSSSRQKRLLKDVQGERQKDSEKVILLKQRQKKLEEREKRHADRIAKEYKRDEEQRAKGAEAARQAGKELQLKRLHAVPVVSNDSDEFNDLTY